MEITPRTTELAPETPQIDFDDDFLKDLGFNPENRETTLNELEAMFGGRIFHYDDARTGTVRVMASLCPAFYDILEQGTPSAAAWLIAN